MEFLFSKVKLLEDKVYSVNKKFSNLQKFFNLFKINKNKPEQELLNNNITISGIPFLLKTKTLKKLLRLLLTLSMLIFIKIILI